MSSKPINTFVIIIAVIAAAIAGSLATQFVSGYKQKNDKEMMDKAVREEVQTSQFVAVLSKYFPAEYDQFLSEILAASGKGKDTAQEVKLASYHFMKRFMRTQMPNIVQAQNADIQKVIDEQVDVIQLFKDKSVKMCADFGMRGLGPDSSVDAAAIKELGDVITAQIVAAHGGKENPVERTAPEAEDWKKLIEAMKARGAPEALLSKIFIVGDLNGLTLEEECDFSYILLVSMADLDEETRIKLFALFLGESVKI